MSLCKSVDNLVLGMLPVFSLIACARFPSANKTEFCSAHRVTSFLFVYAIIAFICSELIEFHDRYLHCCRKLDYIVIALENACLYYLKHLHTRQQLIEILSLFCVIFHF